MLKNMLILRDPLKRMEYQTEGQTNQGGFAAILARAGVGKTALLVQIGINAMLKEKNVMHISAEDPVDKVNLWYREVFQRQTQDSSELPNGEKLWDELLHHRFIMTFETETFGIAKLQKRISELITQNIFCPAQIMIDGFAYEASSKEALADLHAFAKEHHLLIWFTFRTHREEAPGERGLPKSIEPIASFFDYLIGLYPEKERIYLKQLDKDGTDMTGQPELFIDPSTMLIKETES